MANRHLARSIIMQTLFESDFRKQTEVSNIIEILHRNIKEFGPGLESDDFLQKTTTGVVKKQKIIDEIIEKAAPDWPIAKIALVDRNILRLGLFELLFGDRAEVPPKVAINEAIELAKNFGGENSSRFINGVLGSVYKEIGEPEKDQVSKKVAIEDAQEISVDRKAGAVVFCVDDSGEIKLAMVHDVFGYWTLAKSTVLPNEDPKETAERAALEEMSLVVDVIEKVSENSYIANHPKKGTVKKNVSYYLAKSDYQPVSLVKDSGGLDDVKWFRLDQVTELAMYNDIVDTVTKAINFIIENDLNKVSN